MDPESSSPPEGLKSTLRRTAGLFIRTLQNRAELFGLELEEEGRWVVAALVWTAAAIFFAVLSIGIVTVTVLLIVPDAARPWVAIGFSVVYLSLAAGAISGLKRHFTNRRPPMADTINELKKDLEWIQPPE